MTAGIRASLEELERSGLDPRSTELFVVLCWLVKDDVPTDPTQQQHIAREIANLVAVGLRARS